MSIDKNKYNEKHIKLGLKVAYLRKIMNLSQEQLAERVGMSAGYLAQIEASGCVAKMSLDTVFALAEEFGCPPRELFDDID